MKYYSINISGRNLAGCKDAGEFFLLRKDNLKITNIFWICTGLEIDPYYIDCTYEIKTAILIFLN